MLRRKMWKNMFFFKMLKVHEVSLQDLYDHPRLFSGSAIILYLEIHLLIPYSILYAVDSIISFLFCFFSISTCVCLFICLFS